MDYPLASPPSKHKNPVDTAGFKCPPECLQEKISPANNEAATRRSDPLEEMIPWAKIIVPKNSKIRIFQWAGPGCKASLKASPNPCPPSFYYTYYS